MAWKIVSNNIAHSLARAAIPARWVSLIATPIVFLVTTNNLTSPHWSTGLTAAGTLLGVYGAWLTLEIFRIGDGFSQQQNKLIEEVRRSVMTGLKVQQAHELRRKYEDAREREDNSARVYWHFKWRFETQDFLGLNLVPDGYARIRILGSNNRAMETDLEQLELPIYTVEVLEVRDNDQLRRGRAYCSCVNGRLFISNNADSLDLHRPLVEFSITGIGAIRVGAVGQRPLNYKRLKDLKDPSSGDEDQG